MDFESRLKTIAIGDDGDHGGDVSLDARKLSKSYFMRANGDSDSFIGVVETSPSSSPSSPQTLT